NRCELDDQRRHGENSECVGRKPMLPGRQNWCGGTVEVQKPGCPSDPRDCGCHNRRGDQSENMAEPVKREVQTEVSLNQPTGQQGFAGVAYCKDKRTQQRAVTHQVGNDRRNGCTDSDRQSRTRSECDQGASRNSRCGPENSNPVRLGQKEQAETRRKKI